MAANVSWIVAGRRSTKTSKPSRESHRRDSAKFTLEEVLVVVYVLFPVALVETVIFDEPLAVFGGRLWRYHEMDGVARKADQEKDGKLSPATG